MASNKQSKSVPKYLSQMASIFEELEEATGETDFETPIMEQILMIEDIEELDKCAADLKRWSNRRKHKINKIINESTDGQKIRIANKIYADIKKAQKVWSQKIREKRQTLQPEETLNDESDSTKKTEDQQNTDDTRSETYSDEDNTRIENNETENTGEETQNTNTYEETRTNRSTNENVSITEITNFLTLQRQQLVNEINESINKRYLELKEDIQTVEHQVLKMGDQTQDLVRQECKELDWITVSINNNIQLVINPMIKALKELKTGNETLNQRMSDSETKILKRVEKIENKISNKTSLKERKDSKRSESPENTIKRNTGRDMSSREKVENWYTTPDMSTLKLRDSPKRQSSVSPTQLSKHSNKRTNVSKQSSESERSIGSTYTVCQKSYDQMGAKPKTTKKKVSPYYVAPCDVDRIDPFNDPPPQKDQRSGIMFWPAVKGKRDSIIYKPPRNWEPPTNASHTATQSESVGTVSSFTARVQPVLGAGGGGAVPQIDPQIQAMTAYFTAMFNANNTNNTTAAQPARQHITKVDIKEVFR